MTGAQRLAAAAAIGLTAVACGLIAWGYWTIDLLRGTWFWELRYVVLACGGFVLLSLAEWAATRLTRRITPPKG